MRGCAGARVSRSQGEDLEEETGGGEKMSGEVRGATNQVVEGRGADARW